MRATFESGITNPPLVSGGMRCGGKAPERTAVLVAHPGHGRPGGRDAAPAGGYDGHRPRLSSGTGREVRVNQTGAQTQYQTRAAPRQELGPRQRLNGASWGYAALPRSASTRVRMTSGSV